MSVLGNVMKYLCMAMFALFAMGTTYGQRFAFHNLSVNDGLVQSQARAIAQDVYGNLWVGTIGGLSRFDGISCTNYNTRNGLLSLQVDALQCDAKGNVWIATNKGLSMFNGKTFKHYTLNKQEVRPSISTQQLFIIKDSVWWRSGKDLYQIYKGKINYVSLPTGEASVTAILPEEKILWVAVKGKLWRQEGAIWDSIAFDGKGAVAAPTINRIFKDYQGKIWVTTNNGLYYLNNNILQVAEVNGQILDYPSYFGITEDHEHALWIGTSRGAVRIVGNKLQAYNKKNGLCDNRITDVYTDVEGNVWLASDGLGIYRFSGDEFTVLDETMGLGSGQVMAMASNKTDSLFLGTVDAGLFLFNNSKIIRKEMPAEAGDNITSLCYTHNKHLWIGTSGAGLWELNRDIYRQYVAPQRGFPSNAITSLYEDPEYRMWIGFDQGVVLHAGDSFETVQMAADAGAVQTFLYLNPDSLIIATNKRLYLYSYGHVQPYKTGTIVDSSHVQCLIKQGGYIWFGCHENGVIRYHVGAHDALRINKQNGLRSDFIYNIIADKTGSIWVGTGYGIHKIVLNDEQNPLVTFYGTGKGITGMESNSNSVLMLGDSSIWFGTTNGAVHYKAATSQRYIGPIKLMIKSLKFTNGMTIDSSYYDSVDYWYGVPYHLQLPYKKNNLAFTFQTNTFSGGDQLQYRFMLDGIEGGWSEWSENNQAIFNALPPGNYKLRVQCRGSEDGQVPEITYSFTIITPFQKTPLFKLLLLIGSLGLGVLIQYLYTRRKIRRQKLRNKLRTEEQSKIRLRTAEDFHDEIGNKLTRINVLTNVLRSKINPGDDVGRLLTQIEENTNMLYGGTRDILWSLKPSNDSLFEILMRIKDFGTELYEDTSIQFKFDNIDERWRKIILPMDMSRNLLMIFKEALNNSLKYSSAHHVTVAATLKGRNILHIVLKDDGLGFDTLQARKGNGISNMNNRAARLNGRIYVDSRLGKGTVISLTFKIPRKR